MKTLALAGAFLAGFLMAEQSFASMECGIPPIPPIGCAAVCICDEDGCDWGYVCG